MEPEIKKCPYCGFPIQDTFLYCPTCGKKLKEPPMTITKQIGIYALSLLLPPLGLWPGIRYILSYDSKLKRVGLIAIILTVLSIIITLWITFGFINTIQSSLGTQGAGGQLNQLQNLGY